MLVLSRHKDEAIVIGGSIRVIIIEIRGDKVRLGIEAPKEVTVHRQEVQTAIEEGTSHSREERRRRRAAHLLAVQFNKGSMNPDTNKPWNVDDVLSYAKFNSDCRGVLERKIAELEQEQGGEA